jgi:hypothetical protein
MVFDREIFAAAIRVPDTQDAFLEICTSLGIEIKKIQPGEAVAQAGTKYSPEQWKKLKFRIPEFPDLAQPGEQVLAGAFVHMWLRACYLEFTIGPGIGPCSVDESDYLRAKALDELLLRPGLQFREPPYDDDSCVSPKYYPEYWR